MVVVSRLIGIGIELTDPVFAKLLADRLATLSELRQHGHTELDPKVGRPHDLVIFAVDSSEAVLVAAVVHEREILERHLDD